MERVDRLQADYGLEIEGKPFLLRPDTPKEGKPRPLRPGESPDELSEPLRTEAEQAGLVMHRPPIVSYTRYALEATEYAGEQGKFYPFHLGLYRAYWEDGKDLGDLEIIREVADKCELDWPELRHALESGRYQEPVMRQYREAVELGVRGIPAFLIGEYLFTGARPYEVFQAVVGKVLDPDS